MSLSSMARRIRNRYNKQPSNVVADAKAISEANKMGGGANKKLYKKSNLSALSKKGLVTRIMGGILG